MTLSVAAFNAQLKAMGQTVAWRRADTCPCRNVRTGSGSPDSKCPACAGTGFIWAAPVAAWTGVASQRVAREWARFNAWESGDELVSIGSDSPLYAIGENDRIVMVQSSEPFSVVLERTGKETLNFPVVSISRVFWLDPVTRAIIDGEIPTVNADGTLTFPGPAPALAPVTTEAGLEIVTTTGQELDVTVPPITLGGTAATDVVTDTGEVIDFGDDVPLTPPLVGADQSLWRGYSDGLAWTGTGVVPAEVYEGRLSSGQYTVTGRKNPEYFCFKELPQDRAHFGGLALPRRAQLRRWSLFGVAGT